MSDTPEQDEAEAEPYDDWEHREAARKINGIYSNRIFVQPTQDGLLRVNFGEAMDDEPSYHTAVVLSPTNAASFAELIYRMASALLPPAPVITPAAPIGGESSVE